MTTFDACIAQLESLLEAENAALSRMDVEAVAALTCEKNRIVNLLRDYHLDPSRRPDMTEGTAGRLSRVADDNKILLERAMRVQRRLMAIVAASGKPAVTSYGRNGVAAGGAVQPRAMIARA